MTKNALEEFLLLNAQFAREHITQERTFLQQAIIMDMKGEPHIFVIARDATLHGPKMAALLRRYAETLGGADAFVVSSDARIKVISLKNPNQAKDEIEKINEAAKRGEYTIGDDPANRECLLCFGRSHEHVASIIQPYRRKKNNHGKEIIVFDDPHPKLEHADRIQTSMIPNIWAHAS